MKIKDRILLGVVSGVLGSIPGRLLNTFEYHAGLTETMYGQMAASVFVDKKYINSPPGKLLGSIVNQIIALGPGILATYALSFTGRDYAPLKGAAIGTVYWLAISGGVSNLVSTAKPKKPLTSLLGFLDHVIFGTSSALIAASLGDDSLFPDSNSGDPSRSATGSGTSGHRTFAASGRR